MSNSGELHVVFGSGPIGSAVMSELLTQRYKVRIVNRHMKMNVPEDVVLVQGDVTDPACLYEVQINALVARQTRVV